jgi:hypothetical protein
MGGLPRRGRLPRARIAPPATGSGAELVRHRAKLVAIRSGCSSQVHAVLDGCGIQVLISDLFADPCTVLLEHLDGPSAEQPRVQAIRSCGYLAEMQHPGGEALHCAREPRWRRLVVVHSSHGLGGPQPG